MISDIKNFPSNLKIRLLTLFANRTVNSAITPFMTLFFAINIGTVSAGVITLIQIVISYFSNIVGGFIGDQKNEKKLLLITQVTHSIIQFMIAISLFFKVSYLFVVILFFLSVGVGNLYRATFSSLLISSVDEKTKKSAFTIDYLLTNIAMGIGVLIGGVFFNKLQYILFFLSGFILLGIAIIINKRFVFSLSSNKNNDKHNFFSQLLKNYQDPLQNKRFIKYVIGVGLVTSATLTVSGSALLNLQKYYVNNSAQLNIFKVQITISGANIFSFMQIENVCVVVFLTLLSFKWLKKYSVVQRLVSSGLVLSVCYGLLNWITNIWCIFFIVALASIAEIIFAPESQSLLVDLVPQNKKSSYMALNVFNMYIAQGGAAIGVLVFSMGYEYATIYTIFAGIIGVALLKNVVKREKV